ncbi:MAG: hypothetical protein AAFV07_15340, partial [Bacteroidota bacterium]
PVVTYSAIGALLIVVLWDWGRYFIPSTKYRQNRLWLYEHIYKMISAFTALLSAFFGTVLPSLQPHSQYLPSVFGVLLILVWWGITKKRSAPNRAPKQMVESV